MAVRIAASSYLHEAKNLSFHLPSSVRLLKLHFLFALTYNSATSLNCNTMMRHSVHVRVICVSFFMQCTEGGKSTPHARKDARS